MGKIKEELLSDKVCVTCDMLLDKPRASKGYEVCERCDSAFKEALRVRGSMTPQEEKRFRKAFHANFQKRVSHIIEEELNPRIFSIENSSLEEFVALSTAYMQTSVLIMYSLNLDKETFKETALQTIDDAWGPTENEITKVH